MAPYDRAISPISNGPVINASISPSSSFKVDAVPVKASRGNDVISRLSGFIQQQKNVILINLETSFTALFLCLERKGVSIACIREMSKQIKNNDHSCNIYINVLEQCQQYVGCIASNILIHQASADGVSNRNLTETIDIESMFQLIISCWSHLCVYVNQQYKQAYKHHHGLKSQMSSFPVSSCDNESTVSSGRASSSPPVRRCNKRFVSQVEHALQQQIKLAEESCNCQKGLLIAQANERKEMRLRRAQQTQLIKACE